MVVGKKGFTLIETLITISVLVVLSTIAMPIFNSIIQSNATASETNSFISYVMLARQEAVNRGSPVIMCSKKEVRRECSSSDRWDAGWLLFEDSNLNNTFDNSDVLISVGEIYNKSIKIRASDNIIEFLPNGFVSEDKTFNFIINQCVNDNNKKLEIFVPNNIKTTSVACG